MKKYLTVILGGLMTFGAATAQVVTPPTPAPAKTPDYVPPAEPAAQPPAQPKRNPAVPGQPSTKRASIPKVDYKPIGEKGADGKLLPLTDTPQRLSLLEVHNPLIKAEHRPKVDEYLAKRDHRMEAVAVDNLDLVEQLEGGLIDKLDFAAKESQGQSFKNARALTEPINPFGDLISDMARRQVLDDVQSAMSDKLVNEYRTAVRDASRVEGQRRVDSNWMARYTYNNKAQEAILSADRVRAMAVAKAAEVLPKAGLDSVLVSKLTEACKKAPSDAKGRVECFNVLGKDLTIEQRRAWLKAALATRATPEGDPLVPFPKTTGRRPAGEDPNADPNAEPSAEPGAEPTEPPQNK
ncbi:MAG: hypothetical protein U0638_10680 [Phycisphaerales bacterium]